MTLEEENRKLRELLWLRHGHSGLYGDDGEMQCGICLVDFKRMPVEIIEQAFTDDGWKQLIEAKQKTGVT